MLVKKGNGSGDTWEVSISKKYFRDKRINDLLK